MLGSKSMKKILSLLGLLIGVNTEIAYAQTSHPKAWETIKTYFSPPPAFSNQYGDYKSLLFFNNGKTVTTTKQWKKRRAEIFNDWQQLMGKWPEFIKKQTIAYLDTIDYTNYTQYKISYKWTPNEKTVGYLLVPKTKGKKPAVITTFYEPETAIGKGKPNRDFALQLVKRGFVTLSIGTTQSSKNQTYSIYYPSITDAKVQPLSMLAYAAVNSWYLLANLPYVNNKKIGIIGHSFGGKWAMFASCLFDKFACAVWSDPGVVFDETKGNAVNYWEPWYLGYYPTPWHNVWRKTGNIKDAKGLYPKLIKEKYDLHEIMALMAPRPFLVSGGSSDPIERWVALNHIIKINKLLGFENRVAMQNRPLHEPNDYSNSVAYDFFEYFLK